MGKKTDNDAQIAAGQLPKEKEYWVNTLRGDIIKSNFPYDNALRTEIYNCSRNDITFELPENICSMLSKLSGDSDNKIFLILLTAIIVLLGKYTANKKIIVGTTIEKQRVESDYINLILPILCEIDSQSTFKEMLLKVREIVIGAVRHQNYPMQALINELGLSFYKKEFPLFDVAVIFDNIHSREYLSEITPNVIFEFFIIDNTVKCKLEYNTTLYNSKTITNIKSYLNRLLEIVLNSVEIKLENIVLMSEEEIDFIDCFNSTELDYPKEKLIQELFEEQVLKFPDKAAVKFSDSSISYKELDNKSNQLAWLLRSKGVKENTIVGLMIGRSIELIIGILSILKSGGAYLPLDATLSRYRNEFQIRDSNTKLLLTTSNLIEGIDFDGEVILLDRSENYCFPCDKLPRASDSNSVAYMIYTSGTTGLPKGVIISQKSLVNYIWWASKVYIKGSEMNFPLFTSFAFDLTVTSIFTPLITGNTIIIYEDQDDKEPTILRIIKENKVEIVKLTPSHLKLIKGRMLSDSKIKCLILGGENLEVSLAKEFTELYSGKVEIFNEYGPTEATVGCMIYKYDYCNDNAQYVPIGSPIDNMQIYLLDRNLKHVIKGAEGEIYISGDGIAKGYYNRDELTCEKFIDNPFMEGRLMYKTGDTARWISNNCIEFIGRLDDQIKLRGFRIEPGEIELRLKTYNNIEDAVVLLRETEHSDKELCAYIVADSEINALKLKEFLEDSIPNYMIPSVFFKVNSIPLNENGKVDKKKLLGQGQRINLGTEYISPRNDIERKLVSIWESVLETEKLGVKDEFFNAGGDSIKSIRLLNEINKEFETSFELVELYENTTIESFALLIVDKNVEESRDEVDKVKEEINNFKRKILQELL